MAKLYVGMNNTRRGSGGYGTQTKRRYTPADAAEDRRLEGQRAHSLDQDKLRLAYKGQQAQERIATGAQKSASERQTQMTVADLVSKGFSPDEARKAAGGGAASKPQKKVYDPGEARRVRSKENMLYAQGRKRYAATHPAEAQKAGKITAQAAPGTPEVTFDMQDAGAAGKYFKGQREQYEKSPVHIRGLAEFKQAKNARLAEQTETARQYQISQGPFAGPQNQQALGDFQAASRRESPPGTPQPYTPNMGQQPEQLTPQEQTAMNMPTVVQAQQQMNAYDPKGYGLLAGQIDQQRQILENSPPGTPQAKQAQVVLAALQKAQGAMAGVMLPQNSAVGRGGTIEDLPPDQQPTGQPPQAPTAPAAPSAPGQPPQPAGQGQP